MLTQIPFRRLAERYGLAGIIILGFALRVLGINFGLPHLYHADEPIVVNHALGYGTGDLNPHFFKIPPLTSYILFFIYGVIYVGGHGLRYFDGVQDFERFFYADPTLFYLTGRFFLGVLPGTLSLCFFYQLCKKISGSSTALIAVFLFSISFLHVRDSHYIYADIPLLLCLIAGFSSIISVIDHKVFNWKVHFAAGVWVGVASAVKYNGVFLFAPYAMSVYLSGSWRNVGFYKRTAYLFFAALIAAVTFFSLNPFALLDWKFFVSELLGEAAARSSGTGVSHHLVYSLVGALGLPMLLFSAAGGAVILTRAQSSLENKAGFAVLSFIGVYYGVLVIAGQHYDRYVLPLLPFLCFLAAVFLKIAAEALDKVKLSQPMRTVLMGGLVFVVAIVPLYKSVKCNLLFQSPDLRTEVADWIETHLPSGSKIAMETPFYMPRLFLSEKVLMQKLHGLERLDPLTSAQKRRLAFMIDQSRKRKAAYDLYTLQSSSDGAFLMSPEVIDYDLELLISRGVQYVIAVDAPHVEPAKSFWENVEKKHLLKKRFTPYKNAEIKGIFDTIALTGAPFTLRELWERRCNGQPLKIYKI